MNKKMILFSLITTILISLSFGQISSFSQGGFWGDTLTWVGHVIPDENDDVTIVGPITGSSIGKCINLTIANGGELKGGSTEILGDLFNHGSIAKSDGGTCTITLYGNITNEGTYNTLYTYLKGERDHFFEFSESSSFSSTSLKPMDALDIIYSNSDLTFTNTTIQSGYLQGWNGVMIMRENHTLTLDNSSLSYMDINANGNDITLMNQSFVNYVVAQNPVFNGIVNVKFSLIGIGEIINNGIIRDDIYGVTSEFNINGSIINNGTIEDNSQEGYQSLSISIMGDITSPGNWSAGFLNFAGESDQNISMMGLVSDITITKENPEYDLNILSDIKLDSCRISFSNATINLLNNANFILSGTQDYYSDGYINYCTIEANNGDVTFQNRAYAGYDIVINNANLKGTFNINTGNIQFNGNTILSDTLQVSDQATSGPDAYFSGNFVNNGVIQKNGNYRIRFHTSGTVINNGYWDTSSITFDEGATTVSCQNGSIFNSDYFQTEIKDTITAVSDINITNARLSFQEGLFVGNGHTLNFQGSGYYNYLSDVSLQDFSLEGCVKLSDDVIFQGTTILQDTMMIKDGAGSGVTAKIEGDFTNNGMIQKNNGMSLSFETYGDIVNNGSWECYYFKFFKPAENISCGETGYFETDYFQFTALDTLNAVGNLYFLNSEIDLNKGVLLGNNHDFHFKNTGYPKNIKEATLTDFSFYGNIQLYGNDIILQNITVEDTIIGSGTTKIEGDFINNGYITKNAYSIFQMDILGDAFNYGKWENTEIKVDGSENQSIYYPVNKPILSKTKIYSDIGISFQWLKNGSNLTNETSNYLELDSLISTSYGNYNCETNDGTSRTVKIFGGISADFLADKTEGISPLQVQFSDNSLGAITDYKWYFGDGDSSDIQNPKHNYSIPELYDVTLIVNDGNQLDTLTKIEYINVSEYIELVADFSADTTWGLAPFLVHFSDKSLGNVTTYKWYFGDDDSSDVQHPEHLYGRVGFWDVTLIVSDGFMADTLTKISFISTEAVSVEEEYLLPTKFRIYPAYPNPFNSSTNLKFDLPKQSHVRISVYDLNGNLVSILYNSIMEPGYKEIHWNTLNHNGLGLASGVYMIKIDTQDNSGMTKVLYIK